MLRHEVTLESVPGQGATFSIRVPPGEAVVEEGRAAARRAATGRCAG